MRRSIAPSWFQSMGRKPATLASLGKPWKEQVAPAASHDSHGQRRISWLKHVWNVLKRISGRILKWAQSNWTMTIMNWVLVYCWEVAVSPLSDGLWPIGSYRAFSVPSFSKTVVQIHSVEWAIRAVFQNQLAVLPLEIFNASIVVDVQPGEGYEKFIRRSEAVF